MVTASCSRTLEACTTELGIHIDPREATLGVGEALRPDVETSTCGGSIRGVPIGLTLVSQDPAIASVDDDTIIGVAPGATAVDVRSNEDGHLGVISVRVSP